MRFKAIKLKLERHIHFKYHDMSLFLEVHTYKIEKCQTRRPSVPGAKFVYALCVSLIIVHPGVYTYIFSNAAFKGVSTFEFYQIKLKQCGSNDKKIIFINEVDDYQYVYSSFSKNSNYTTFMTPRKPKITIYLKLTTKSCKIVLTKIPFVKSDVIKPEIQYSSILHVDFQVVF